MRDCGVFYLASKRGGIVSLGNTHRKLDRRDEDGRGPIREPHHGDCNVYPVTFRLPATAGAHSAMCTIQQQKAKVTGEVQG